MQALYDFVAGTLNTVAWIYILLPCVFVGGLYYILGAGSGILLKNAVVWGLRRSAFSNDIDDVRIFHNLRLVSVRNTLHPVHFRYESG